MRQFLESLRGWDMAKRALWTPTNQRPTFQVACKEPLGACQHGPAKMSGPKVRLLLGVCSAVCDHALVPFKGE